jgi:MFS family permease
MAVTAPSPGAGPVGPGATDDIIETRVPARLDRLPWSRWHWVVLLGLGTVWILDGLEVTIVGAVGSTLTAKGSGISISTAQVGQAAAFYIGGACLGALVFGHLTDRLGRKRLFLVTLLLYLCATMATGLSVTAWMFFLFRFLTGMGIGGEYAAINSAIDELIPARVRGTVDLLVNGSYWLGTAAGAAATLVLLDPALLATNIGWRLCFLMGAVLGVGVLLVRRTLPESPRWLFTHGRAQEADAVVDDIERQVVAATGQPLAEPEEAIRVHQRGSIGILTVIRTMFVTYPRRSWLGFSLFVGQAFLYNAIFFTYSLVLTTFYKVPAGDVGYYLIAFAVGNFLGPLLLGRLFDVVGRRVMIAGTYLVSGAMLAVTAWLVDQGVLTATTQTVAWTVIFFFASAGASAAYLTVSEVFPMETRALAIAAFYALGTFAGGVSGPWLFGALVASKQLSQLAVGYLIGGGLMIASGVVEIFLGVDAEQKSLEEIAAPLSAASDGEEAPAPVPAGRGARRPMPGTAGRRAWSPLYQASTFPPGNPPIEAEVGHLVAALEERGPLSTSGLSQALGGRYWGPGRLRTALRRAQAEGRVRRIGADRFAATSPSNRPR